MSRVDTFSKRRKCGCDYCEGGRFAQREKLFDLEQITDALLTPEEQTWENDGGTNSPTR